MPSFLIKSGYKFAFSLDDAMEDWKKDCPEEWVK